MKKKLLIFVLVIIGAIATFNINVVENEMGDISLQNIEMLSFGENGNGVNCFLSGSLDCPVNETKVRMIW